LGQPGVAAQSHMYPPANSLQSKSTRKPNGPRNRKPVGRDGRNWAFPGTQGPKLGLTRACEAAAQACLETASKFTKNVYDVWMLIYFKRICPVIDQLPPDLDFEVSQVSELQFTEASGLSQELGGLLSEQSNVESASRASQDDSELASIVCKRTS
jgi:hypothetical protein